MDYLFSWSIATVLLIHTAELCDPGWILYNRFNVCYKLFEAPLMRWAGAKTVCVRQNAKLADIYDYKEQLFIAGSVLQNSSGRHGVWLGASDIAEDGEWRWVDNTTMDIGRFEWWEGNPDNNDVFWDFDLFGEDCLEISLKEKHRGKLNDYKCQSKMPFLCKKKEIQTTPKTTQIATPQPSTDADDKSTILTLSIVAALSSLTLLVVCIVALIRRKWNKKKSSNNYYEDAHVSPPANENFYASLANSDHKDESNGLPDSSFHEYHSVAFSVMQSDSVKSKETDYLGSRAARPKPLAYKRY